MTTDKHLTFKASCVNSAGIERNFNVVTVKKNGVPLAAGDIKQGEIISVNIETGECQ